MKLALQFLLAKLNFANLVVKCSAVSLVNSWLVINLSWPLSVAILFSISVVFVLSSAFLTKSLTSGILFSTAVKGGVEAKLVVLGILFLTSFILALRAVVVVLS